MRKDLAHVRDKRDYPVITTYNPTHHFTDEYFSFEYPILETSWLWLMIWFSTSKTQQNHLSPKKEFSVSPLIDG